MGIRIEQVGVYWRRIDKRLKQGGEASLEEQSNWMVIMQYKKNAYVNGKRERRTSILSKSPGPPCSILIPVYRSITNISIPKMHLPQLKIWTPPHAECLHFKRVLRPHLLHEVICKIGDGILLISDRRRRKAPVSNL
jgi:hypothetical protein